MEFLFGIVLLGIGAMLFLDFLDRKKKSKPTALQDIKVERKIPLTNAEQNMFWHLKKVFVEPEFVVLSQVSMSALLTSDWRVRNRFSQKYVDFVVCSRDFVVLAVIELDDWSHDNKQEQDAARDAMLRSAGLNALRYRTLPDLEKLRTDVLGKQR